MKTDSRSDRVRTLWAILSTLSTLGFFLFGIMWEMRWRRIARVLERRQRTAEEWAERALHDPLTNLPNRMLLTDRLEQALIRARRNNTSVAVLFIDLDNFKSVNDRYGHLVGDRVLIAIGERLRQHLRASDTAGRLGGDEFVVLLEMKDGGDDALMVAERLRRALHVPLVLDPEPISLHASIGVAIADTGNLQSEDLLHRADTALLEAKQAGKDRIVLASLREQPELSQEEAFR